MCSYSSSSCCCCDRCVSPGSRGATAGEGGEGGQPEVTIVAVAAVEAEWRARAAPTLLPPPLLQGLLHLLLALARALPFFLAFPVQAKQTEWRRIHQGSLGLEPTQSQRPRPSPAAPAAFPRAAAPEEQRSNAQVLAAAPLPMIAINERLAHANFPTSRRNASGRLLAISPSLCVRFMSLKQGT